MDPKLRVTPGLRGERQSVYDEEGDGLASSAPVTPHLSTQFSPQQPSPFRNDFVKLEYMQSAWREKGPKTGVQEGW